MQKFWPQNARLYSVSYGTCIGLGPAPTFTLPPPPPLSPLAQLTPNPQKLTLENNLFTSLKTEVICRSFLLNLNLPFHGKNPGTIS